MTEAEWLSGEDPLAMLRFLDKGRDFGLRFLLRSFSERKLRRKLRSYAAHAYYAVHAESARFRDEAERQTLLTGIELWVDAPGTESAEVTEFLAILGGRPTLALWQTSWGLADQITVGPESTLGIRRHQACLLRCLVGNPFRRVRINPRWLTSTVASLAEGIYADRAFDRLPILADALQDAGCEDADILAHSRSGGSHVRGCWVIDLVLGKAG
jgi:hypothetical protein